MRALSSSGICVEVRAETVFLDIANNSSVKGDSRLSSSNVEIYSSQQNTFNSLLLKMSRGN